MSDQTQAHDLLTHERLTDFEPAGDAFHPVPLEDVPAAVEALLFASGDPLTLEQLHRILQVDRDKLRRTMDELKDRYARDRSRGLLLREADGTFVLSTKPNQLDVLSRLFSPRHRPPLTPAAYETLAVIAYNQPVTRAQIEALALRIGQVLINYANNAVKFTEHGEVLLNVSLSNGSDDTQQLLFEVRDTGIGIKAADPFGWKALRGGSWARH